MKKFVKMAVAAAIAGLSLAAQADLVIDDFTTDQAYLTDTVLDASGLSSQACGAGIIGGCRDLFSRRQATRP
ncbi:MAG: hypothetical protein IPO19_13955 [Rhodoferax sp.]|nr:hypothetical protein [Rhodoferax sp.]